MKNLTYSTEVHSIDYGYLTVENLSSVGDVLNPHTELATAMEPKVEIEGARHQSLEVLGVLVLPLVHERLEIEIRDKNHRTIILEALGNIVLTELRGFLHIGNLTGARRITERLEDVQCILIVEDGICIVEDNHVARLPILVSQHIEMNGGK